MGTDAVVFFVVFSAVGASMSAFLAIQVWRRMRSDRSSRLLMWAVLLFPCVGGPAACLGVLFSLFEKSRTMDVLSNTFAVLTVVAVAAHMCLQIVYFLGLLRRRSERGH
jgi:hypothetical protein